MSIVTNYCSMLRRPEEYNTTKKNLIKEIKSYEKKSGTNPHQLEKLKKQLYRLKTPSIIGNLFKMFKFELITVTAIKALSDTIQFANPFILHELIAFISKPHGDLWIGVAYAAGMFIASELRSILHNYHNYLMFRMGVKIQSVLMTAVYKKNLKLSNIARKEKTLGEIVNLMAIDVERFQTITPEIPLYLSIPYQCTLALVFLLTIMGYSALPGVLIMLFAIPLNIFCSKWTRGWNMKQMKLKDERVKMCNEILSGIRVIKFYAWEIPMKEIIERIRKQELVCILKTALVKYSVDVFNWSSPFLVGFFSFLTYTLSDPEHHILTPQVAFVSLTLFNMLRQPMTQTGMLITQTVQVIVSNRRLKDFLVADEHDLDSIKRSYDLNETSTTIEVKNGDFSWEAQEDKVDNKFGNLHDINLEVPSKNLIAVVGKVGCGKSSLLSSLLGEMQKIKGYVSVQGRLAYVPQQAWIQNLPLRDNILFGKPFNKEIYDSVVDACALRPDIAILPQGDMTEIGEKGINLSGGQKARVSLARAVYQNYDVYLLDDPLSAVDSHVGKHIFEKVIGPEGLLRNKTRILVTHGISFLKYMDTIIHIENGRIIDVGTYDELISHKEKFAKLIEEAKTEKQQTGSSTDTNSTNDDPIDRSLSSQKEDADSAISEEDLNKKENSNRRISTISIIEQRKNGYSGKRLDDILIQESKEPPRLKTNQKLIQKEKVETGRVKMNVYKQYAESATYVRSFIFILMYVIYGGVQMLRNFWLSSWEDDEAEHRNDHKMRNLGERLGVYAVYGLGESLALTLSLLALILG
uniref:Uncharacterized protein n=1 Tax=Acrobeloides nanus TaxID=290746 RepID=A0A914ELG9_9BILA